jgi:tetratricopeptide (TPR) repeat protein
MGVVYEAEQVSLNRRVALKVLPFASSLDTSQLQRFQNEARVGALLQHPHIVPVFATGNERGVHYYAMQYIDGPSLASLVTGRRAGARPPLFGETAAVTPAMDDLSTQSSGPDPVGSHVSPNAAERYREAARLGAEAAEALEAAHQAGVIHRDIKPSNLLLDHAGCLWVADFGLARFSSESGLTRTGNLLGTLRYMSPEQALGRPGLVDHRTDLYSLGATIYELLTLRPAFVGRNREELMRQIEHEEPPRPTAIDPAVPKPLEAIVLRAMAKDPADRYATAAELANDLRRFHTGQPVRARLPSRLTRCRRWARRHSTAVLSTAVMIAILLAVVSVAALAFVRQRDVAIAGKRQARRAVDEMYTDVAERWLARQPHLELVQQEFLEKAHRFYQEFARDGRLDPAASLEATRACRRVGDIDSRLGRFAEAEEAYEQARTMLRSRGSERSENDDLCEELALLRTGRGGLFLATDRYAEAEQEFRDALDCFDRLSSGVTERRYILGRVGCQVNLGAVLAATGRPKEAEQSYSQALTTLETQCKADANDAEVLYDLAGVLTDLGNLLAAFRSADAEAYLRRSLAIEDRLLASAPGQPAYRHSRASTSSALASLLVGSDRFAEARSTALRSLEFRERLVADFPHTPRYRQEVAAGRLTLGDILALSGRPTEANSCYRAAMVTYGNLAATSADATEYRRGLAESFSRAGDLLVAAGKPVAAEEYYRAALSKLGDNQAIGRLARQDAARTWSGLGNALFAAGRASEANFAHTTAVEQWTRLAAEATVEDSDRWGFATALCQYASAQQSSGAITRVEEAYRKAVIIDEGLVTKHPNLSNYRLILAAALLSRGHLLRETGRANEGEADCNRALAMANALASNKPDVPEYRRLFAACLVNKARHSCNQSEALTALRQAAAISRKLTFSPARTLADERLLADALQGLAECHERAGRSAEAASTWREVVRQRKRLAADYQEIPLHRRELAWLLANGPADSVRDVRGALAEARAAVALCPQDPDGCLALGASAYRCGAWNEARAALQRYARQCGSSANAAGFYLAMLHLQEGNREEAAADFDRAETWRQQNRPDDFELDVLGREAADLLARLVRR